MYKGRIKKIFLLPLAALLLGACGLLEGMPFIDPVQQSDIEPSMDDRATVDLRDYSPHPTAFSHFVIYYRIYISDYVEMAPGPINFGRINPTLLSNYNTVLPHIDSDTLFGVNMHNLFSGMNFRYLSLEGNVIDQVLGSAFFNRPREERILEFDFGTAQIPVMRIGSDEFILLRAAGHQGISFSPRPEHRRFLNTEELRNSEYIDPNFNADVASAGTATDPMLRDFTYVAMFIVAVGIDSSTFSTIYSTPSLIHVFRLPD